jgi:hypothetical protein
LPGAPKKQFNFVPLQKSKDEGLLELFWGEQPPFALLRSVEGGTFFGVMIPGFIGATADASKASSGNDCRQNK